MDSQPGGAQEQAGTSLPVPGFEAQDASQALLAEYAALRTGELRDLILAGIPGKPSPLTFSHIYPELESVQDGPAATDPDHRT